jgi:acetolactate synthase-1/2/3 large subunit
VATSGPGATNLVTGIATAFLDSIPIVAVTGNVANSWLGKDSFQEVDIAGVTMPVTKHNFIVKDVTKLAETLRRAFYIAQEGRPGPVLVDMTADVTSAVCEYERKEPRKIEPSSGYIREKDLDRAAELVKNSARPFIYAGGGVIQAGADRELAAFAEKADAPVCLTVMGIGALPSDSPRFTGMIGMHGSKTSNTAVTECDLLIAVGARFSDRVVSNLSRFAPNAAILHIDVDPAEIGKNVKTAHSIIGDAKEALARLIPKIPQMNIPDWNRRIAELKKLYPVTYKQDGALKPQFVMERIGAAARDVVISTDVGQHQMWACQYIPRFRPRSLITSGGLGTMGYGLGAAIGASVALGFKPVINIAGDGCFRMNHTEIATAVAYNVPVIDVVINNHTLGMVRQWQTLFYGGRYAATDLTRTTDFVKLAEAYGALAFRVSRPEETDGALTEALAAKRPAVIVCDVSPDESVFPMVPQGKGVDELILE